MIDFPNSPTVGQQFVAAGVTWQWDGVKWFASAINTAFLPLAGGTMTGPITLAADPTAALNPASKRYVDGIAAQRVGRNRLINGQFAVDQWNAGGAVASQPGTNTYTGDRWHIASTVANTFTGRAATLNNTYPVPATTYGNVSISTPYTPAAADANVLYQILEWANIGDCNFGFANAQPLTLSFWAIATTAGNYSGSICNPAGTRSYPFSFALPASLWTYCSVTIPPDMTGSWVPAANNVAGMDVRFDLGCGSSLRGPANAWASSNFIGVTGAASLATQTGTGLNFSNVQLEVGAQASPYDQRSYGAELALCQRYFEHSYPPGKLPGQVTGSAGLFQYVTTTGATPAGNYVSYKVQKRVIPSINMYSNHSGAGGVVYDANASADVTVTVNPDENGIMWYATSVATNGINFQGQWAANAEL